MTHDDYLQMRGMYADVEELCQAIEGAVPGDPSDEGLRRLVGLFQDQQREPGQVRSFLRHLGVPDGAVGRVLGEAAPGEDPEDDSGIA